MKLLRTISKACPHNSEIRPCSYLGPSIELYGSTGIFSKRVTQLTPPLLSQSGLTRRLQCDLFNLVGFWSAESAIDLTRRPMGGGKEKSM